VPKTFYIANNGMSSSALRFGTHEVHHPGIHFESSLELETARLDSVLDRAAEWDLVNLDVQGAELRALQGLGDLISQVRWVYTEVNEEPVYEACALLGEIDIWLGEKEFTRVDTAMTPFGWGDALYARTSQIPSIPAARRVARRCLTRIGR
jgi:hypothetical protein